MANGSQIKSQNIKSYIKYDKESQDRSKLDVSNNIYILLLNQFILDILSFTNYINICNIPNFSCAKRLLFM